jgi:hypothetical protein
MDDLVDFSSRRIHRAIENGNESHVEDETAHPAKLRGIKQETE